MNQDNHILPKLERKFEIRNNNKEYEVKSIINNTVYGKKAKNQLPDLYYLVL